MTTWDNESIGRRFKKRRTEVGVTQEQLAEKAGMSARGYGNLESGLTKTSPRTFSVKCLAAALNTSTSWLIDDMRVPRDTFEQDTLPDLDKLMEMIASTSKLKQEAIVRIACYIMSENTIAEDMGDSIQLREIL